MADTFERDTDCATTAVSEEEGAILSKEAVVELWRQCVHNKSHRLMHDCQDLRQAFTALLPPDAFGDKIDLFERQLRIVEVELSNLVSCAGRIGDLQKNRSS